MLRQRGQADLILEIVVDIIDNVHGLLAGVAADGSRAVRLLIGAFAIEQDQHFRDLGLHRQLPPFLARGILGEHVMKCLPQSLCIGAGEVKGGWPVVTGDQKDILEVQRHGAGPQEVVHADCNVIIAEVASGVELQFVGLPGMDDGKITGCDRKDLLIDRLASAAFSNIGELKEIMRMDGDGGLTRVLRIPNSNRFIDRAKLFGKAAGHSFNAPFYKAFVKRINTTIIRSFRTFSRTKKGSMNKKR